MRDMTTQCTPYTYTYNKSSLIVNNTKIIIKKLHVRLVNVSSNYFFHCARNFSFKIKWNRQGIVLPVTRKMFNLNSPSYREL